MRYSAEGSAVWRYPAEDCDAAGWNRRGTVSSNTLRSSDEAVRTGGPVCVSPIEGCREGRGRPGPKGRSFRRRDSNSRSASLGLLTLGRGGFHAGGVSRELVAAMIVELVNRAH